MPGRSAVGPVAIAAGLYVAAVLPLAVWNRELFLLVNNVHAPLADRLFGLVAGVGDGLVVALLATALMLWRFRLGLAAVLGFLASGLAAQLLKRLFDAPRPPAVFPEVHLLGAPLTAHSFPSGHATSLGVLFAVGFLLWGLRDWRAWSVALLSVAAAYGRIYGGVHFPVDVWVGFGLGVAALALIWPRLRDMPPRGWEAGVWCWQAPAALLAAEAAVLGLGYRMQPATAQPLALPLSVGALLLLMYAWRVRRGY